MSGVWKASQRATTLKMEHVEGRGEEVGDYHGEERAHHPISWNNTYCGTSVATPGRNRVRSRMRKGVSRPFQRIRIPASEWATAIEQLADAKYGVHLYLADAPRPW